MVSYLDILNDARAEIGRSPISTLGITNASAESLIGIRAVNKALAKVYKTSVDQDFAAKSATTTNVATSNNLLVVPTDTWDPNIINSLWYEGTGNMRYSLIMLPNKEEADNLSFNINLSANANNFPKWWYVFNGSVYILPVPTTVYTLTVYYQGLLSTVDSSQMTSAVSMPPDFLETMRLGVEAYLRKADRDPEWGALEGAFMQDLKLSIQRNKFNRKNNGLQMYQLRRSTGAKL